MKLTAEDITLALNSERENFRRFLVARVGEADADDILQNGLIKALQRGAAIEEEGKLSAWFYRVLRNAITDHYREAGSTRRRHEKLATTRAALEEDRVAAPEWERQLCRCLNGVAATMKPRQAVLIQRVDLGGESVAAVARDLGITANSASVTLHRARQELRTRLEKFCGACASGACLDCDCEPEPPRRN